MTKSVMSLDLAGPQALYPFRPHFLDVGGPRMHYVDEGTGPPIVMLHGNPTWSFYYRELIKDLKSDYRVIAPDHVGCGLSEKPRRYPYTLATHIDNLDKLLLHLDVKDVTLLLHDWGGAIGMGWAVRRPERVRRFVVFNTAAFFYRRTPLRIRVCGWPVLGDLVVRGLNGFARAALRMATACPKRLTREVREGYLLPYDSWASRIAILRFVRDIPQRATDPSHAVLQGIQDGLSRFRKHPMLICWGEKDFCFDDRALQGWVSRFPDAVVHRFADAGHYVVEDAHERIRPLMREFLQS